jgi:hypothetical protein
VLRPTPPPDVLADLASLRRSLAAALRWRFVRTLRAALPARTFDGARLATILLHASFQHQGLRGDAPGVAGLHYRRRWTSLARAFDLPPPWRAQRDAPLVDAVLALPEGPGLTLLCLTAAGIARVDQHRLEERLATAQTLLGAAGATCALRLLEPPELARDPLLGHQLVAFGGLVAGRLSSACWAALEALARRPLDPRDLVELAAEAPGRIPALALALLCGEPAPAPLQVAARCARRGVPALRLADPAFLCVRWAAEAQPQHAAALEQALSGGPRDGGPEGVVALANGLALPLARAIHRAGRAGLSSAERAHWRERLGPDLPRALLPALSARLRDGAELTTTLHRAGAQHEVRLRGGAVLGRGGTPVQARVRALAVLASAALEPLLAHAEPPWRAVAARLAQPRAERTVVLVVEPAGPSGPPYDPLNRGPDRRLGFTGGLVVRLAPGRRPSARGLTAGEVVERLVREAAAGTRVEVLPSRPEAHPVAARLAQLVAFVQSRTHLPLALEAGGVVRLLGDRERTFSVERLAARPRVYLPDPDAPDLSLAPGERRPPGLAGASVISCRVQLLDAGRAAVLYADDSHGQLREEVFLPDLEDHLREARAVLQAADPRAVFTVHLADDLPGALRRAGPPGPPLELAVRARLPWDLQVEVEGEWYGGTTGRTWREAALKLLVRWPREIDARLAVTTVSVVARGRRRGGLLALYARSLALRRMRTHLVRTLRAYQKPRARRSGG